MKDEEKRAISVIQEISRTVVFERNIGALLQNVLDLLHRRMGMLRGTFTLKHGDELRIEASQGLDEAEKKRGRYRVGEGITGSVAKTGRAEVVNDISADPRFLNRTGSHRRHERLSFICVPIMRHERVIGTLSIECAATEGNDLESDLMLLEIIGSLTAEAVQARRQEHEEREQLLGENRRLRQALAGPDDPIGEIVGTGGEMQQVFALIRQVAPSSATVLIRGSSGTGKELVASAIRKLSARATKPFVTLNCAALPESLVESEIFGHEKGAFTGAVGRRIGRAEAADGGTLFLDEIGDLSPPIQVKLLRFIQERTFSRVGSNEELKADVRIIAATSRDLEQLMAEEKFREDLYYRLNIFPIALPDLCKRRCDIIPLAEHFIEKHNLRYGKSIKRLSTPAINMLMSYHWPGNVRELENCMERAILTASDDCIHGYNLPPSLQTGSESGTSLLPDGTASFNTLVGSFERELIVEALKRKNGNMSAAARDLGLSPRVMHYKINGLGIKADWYRK